MHIADAATIILIVAWLTGVVPGWTVFVPLALSVAGEARRRAIEDDEG